jgi:RNA polymerase sigma factor (sigma-70 family)
MELVNYVTPEDTEAYRVKVTVRNNLLLSAIEQAGYRYNTEFAKEIGFQPTRLGLLIGLREAPIKKDGDFTDMAKKIMEVLGAAPSDLWTVEQLNMSLEKNVWEDQFNTEMVRSILGGNVAQLEGAVYKKVEQPEEAMDKKELKDVLEKGLERLTPREKQVLCFRFGLCGQKEHTLEEIAEIMHVTRERVRQIEQKGLRKMRNPSISKTLEAHAEDLMSTDTYKPVWEELEDEDSRND